jgi:hypothetical protein
MNSSKLLSDVVDEALLLSPSPPTIVSTLRAELCRHYAQATIMVSDDYPSIIDKLYGINDGVMYSILSLSFEDEYTFFLLPAQDVAPNKTINAFLTQLKMRNDYNGEETMKVVMALHVTTRTLNELLTNSTRSSRRSVGNNKKADPKLPSLAKMKAFYECERKVKYTSVADATEQLEEGNNVYLCEHCGQVHQGKEPTGQPIPQYIMNGRYSTAWRRYHKI